MEGPKREEFMKAYREGRVGSFDSLPEPELQELRKVYREGKIKIGSETRQEKAQEAAARAAAHAKDFQRRKEQAGAEQSLLLLLVQVTGPKF